jgi:curved DNA-binding protein CbpA
MRDLYRRLALERSASPEEIRAALERLPDMKSYSAILLDEERRAVYDRAHNTLKMIALLRFRLGLDESDNSFIQRYPDFAIMPKPVTSSATQESSGHQGPDKTTQRRDRTRRNGQRWLLPLLLSLIVIGAIVLFLHYY